MVDIFDEVEEDLRAERAQKLLKKFGWVLIAVAIVVIAAAAGWQLWNRHQAQRDADAALQFVTTQDAAEQPGASKAGLVTVFEQLASAAPEGYQTLARLSAASLKADTGDLQGAIALWNGVASDDKADRLLRDLAILLAVQHDLDHGDPAQLESRLKPLAEPSNPWSALAQEQLAMLDLRQGRLDDARLKLRALSVDVEAPTGLRARVAALLAGLGPQGDR